MHYTRIHTDAAGESHFEDVTVSVAPVDFAPPAPPLNVAPPIKTERIVFTTISAGWVGDWHPTPCRQFFLQLSGDLEVQTSDGETRRFSTGDIVLIEDTVGKGHVTRVVGNSDVHAAFVQLPDSTDSLSS